MKKDFDSYFWALSKAQLKVMCFIISLFDYLLMRVTGTQSTCEQTGEWYYKNSIIKSDYFPEEGQRPSQGGVRKKIKDTRSIFF
jgi:hypothetical protein